MDEELPITELLGPIMAFQPTAIYHFGSRAQDPPVVRSDSDLDLAFLSTRPCQPYDVFLAAQEIARLAGRDVDLVDLSRTGDVFTAQVVSSGKRVYTAPGMVTAADEFEMLALSNFARLNEERLPILERELAS